MRLSFGPVLRATILGATALALATTAAYAQTKPAPQRTFIHAGQLLADPASGRVLQNQTIVVENGRIVEIRPGFVGEGNVVDLRQRFVLPGLIDSHVHITSEQNPNARLQGVTLSDADRALMGAANARKTLMAGFTTVADLGGPNEAVFALREAVKRGDVPGPRIIAAGTAVTVHGGHGDVNGYSEDIMHLLSPESACDGPDDCMRAVRLQVRAGADVIKITATGGVLSNTAAGLAQQFTDAELAAIVEAGHRMGRKVTAHAHGADGVNAFLRAGGDSIEHGTYLDDDSIKLFREKGAYLVPTVLAGDFVYRIASSPGNFFTPAQTAKAIEAGPKMIDMARRAHAGGVKIAFGTDTGVSPHGENAKEFALLVRAGMTPLEAIRSATVVASEHLGLNAELGTIAPGKAADIVAVGASPLQDVTELQRMRFVMRNGVVHRND